jgi:hypothetical protein
MNNTKTLAAIAAILIAGTLVVAGTLAATSATSAFAYQKKRGQDDSKNGSTVTIQACKQRGSVSGFDNRAEQECGNTICTHPSSNAVCVSENEQVTPVPTPGEVGCPDTTLYNVRLLQDLVDGTTIPKGTVLCLDKKLGEQTATISSLTPVDAITTRDVVVAQPNHAPCNNSMGNSGFVLAHVESFGNPPPGNPIVFHGTVCVKDKSHTT